MENLEMGNPVDPLNLLKAMSPMLDIKGGVNGVDEMENLVKLMKEARQLVSRCVYLNILRVTESTALMEKFISFGGWHVMNMWLCDAKNSENMALILEVLKLLQRLPLRIDHLKQNNTPKLVKAFAKSSSCSKVKSLASSLMNGWLTVIREASGSVAASSDAVKKKKDKLKGLKPKEIKKQSKDQRPPPVAKAPSFAKFRKTGLEGDDDATKKPKPEKTSVAGKRSSIDGEDASATKKAKIEAKLPPKKITMSGGFMDALNSIPVTGKRTVKRRPVKTKQQSTSPAHKPSPTHDLMISGEAADFGVMDVLAHSPSPIPSPKEPAKPKLNKYGKPQKTLTWAVESRLEAVRYFEVEEGERGTELAKEHEELRRRVFRIPCAEDAHLFNVTHQSFKDAMQRDKLQERETLGGFHHKGEGTWTKPKLIDLPAALAEIGCNSIEKDIQAEREKTVLQEIFLTPDMVPDTPAEPDPEPYDMVPPKIIPIDDPNDPGCVPSPTESPDAESSTMKPTVNGLISSAPRDNGSEIVTDKLREILQTAAATSKTEATTTTKSDSYSDPNANQMELSDMDPNMAYPSGNMVPPLGNGFYPQGPILMGPPHLQMMPPNMPPMAGGEFNMDWSAHPMPMNGPPRGGRGIPPNMGRGGPRPPRYRPSFGPGNGWEPRRGPWHVRRNAPRDFRGGWSQRPSFRR